MGRFRTLQQLAAAILAVESGCSFDTAPLSFEAAATSDAGPDKVWQPQAATSVANGAVTTAMPVSAAITPASPTDAAVSSAGQDATATAMATATAQPAQDTAAAGSMAAAPAPAAGAPATACPPACPTQPMVMAAACDPLGSYGLRIAADVVWSAASSWAGAGRGTAHLYALLRADQADPQTGAATVTGRVCGLVLPPVSSDVSCTPFELRFADTLWETPNLPELEIGARYSCTTSGCVLGLDPMSYTLGIRLDPMQGSWPAAGTASVSQFVDDDADGMPGVTVSIWQRQAMGPSANCGRSPFAGQGGQGNPSGSMPGRVFLGLRAQLSAALAVAPDDCRLSSASGSMQSIELRAAGCHLEAGATPAGSSPNGMSPQGQGPPSESDNCGDVLRNAIDQGLPQYAVLEAGQPPATPSTPDMSPGRGTVVDAVRLPAGATCHQVRAASFGP